MLRRQQRPRRVLAPLDPPLDRVDHLRVFRRRIVVCHDVCPSSPGLLTYQARLARLSHIVTPRQSAARLGPERHGATSGRLEPMPASPLPRCGPQTLARGSVRPGPAAYLVTEINKILTTHDHGRAGASATGVPQSRNALPHVPSRELPLKLLTAEIQVVARGAVPAFPGRLPLPGGHRITRQERPHAGRADRPYDLTVTVSLQAQRAVPDVPSGMLGRNLYRNRLPRPYHRRLTLRIPGHSCSPVTQRTAPPGSRSACTGVWYRS